LNSTTDNRPDISMDEPQENRGSEESPSQVDVVLSACSEPSDACDVPFAVNMG